MRASVTMGGKAKPKKHTAAELAATAKAATTSVGGGGAGIQDRDKTQKIKAECQEPGCGGVKLASLTVAKTHWSTKHCTCKMVPDMCSCFPKEKYECMFVSGPAQKTHHNQAATQTSNKNASKAVRDQVKARQAMAAMAICDESRRKTHEFTAKAKGPGTI